MSALDDIRSRYLDLVRDSLVGLLHEDPRLDVGGSGGLAAFDRSLRVTGSDRPATAFTMIGERRMLQLQQAAETAIRDRIPGDFLEAGAWRGGACILMRAVLAAWGDERRRVWVADSFEGMPPLAPGQPGASVDKLRDVEGFVVSADDVRANFARYDLLDDRVVFLEGWFRDTLRNDAIDTLAILRIDAVLRESTTDALAALYDKVAPGGYVILDDYGAFAGCRAAVAEFRRDRGITDPIEWIDDSGAWWRRGAA